MKAWRRVLQAAVLWCASASLATGLDPFSAGAAMGIGAVSTALYTGWGRIQCQFKECCQPPWVTNNLTHFEGKLRQKLRRPMLMSNYLSGLTRQHVFGQHLAVQVVTRALRAHLSKKEPRKALVLSFHGWTGGGKNYVARFVAESLFKEGLRSKFVHLFMSTLHFPNEELVDEYKVSRGHHHGDFSAFQLYLFLQLNLQDWIRGNVSACAQTLFIFDEIDKMPEGVIDAIKPFIDFHPSINGIDFRRSIFIFLSNTGGREITTHTFEYFKEGRTRESLQLKDYEAVITGGAFNEIGGLHKCVEEQVPSSRPAYD